MWGDVVCSKQEEEWNLSALVQLEGFRSLDLADDRSALSL